jgi:MFS family permease
MGKKSDKPLVYIPGDSEYVANAKTKAKERFIAQGAVSEASSSLSSSFIVPFAKAIGANAAHIGFLSAFSGLIAPLGNLWGSKLMEKHSRKHIHISYTAWMSVIWIPLILLSFLYTRQVALPWLPYALIVLYSMFIFFGAVKDPASFSWIGDIVNENERGHYFARRNKVIGWVGVGVFLIGGLILNHFEAKSYVLVIYSLVFFVSIILRIVSLYQVKHVFSPHFKLMKTSYFSFWSFVKRYDDFGKFAVFQAFFNFAVMIASPFFAVYMLDDLHFNLFWFTAISLSSTIFYLLLTPWAGKFSDKYGNLPLLYIAAWVFPLTPLLWLFLKDPILLFFLPGFTAGLGNAAFGIGATNYIYDSVGIQKRARCFTYSNLLSGVGIFLGSILGGLMIQYLHVNFMNTTLFVFVVAATLRFLVAFIFVPQLKEPRPEHSRLKGLMWDVFHPFKTIHADVVWFKKFVHEKD